MDNLLLLIGIIGLIVGVTAIWLNQQTNRRIRINQDRTKNALSQVETRLLELDRQFQQEQQERVTLPAGISTLPTQLETLDRNYEELQSRLSTLQTQLETSDRERRQLNSQVAQLQNQFEAIAGAPRPLRIYLRIVQQAAW